MNSASGSLMGKGGRWRRSFRWPGSKTWSARRVRSNSGCPMRGFIDSVLSGRRDMIEKHSRVREKSSCMSTPCAKAARNWSSCTALAMRKQKAQETARVEEAIARRKQEKEQWWNVVISGLEGGSLSGQPGLTQPGTGAVGDLSGLTTLSPDSLTTAQQPKQPASNPTVWKTFTSNIVKLAGGKQDSKKDDPASSVGDLSGPTTLSPDSLTTAQQPEASAQQPEISVQQPETSGWVTDSQGDWVWQPGKDDSQPPTGNQIGNGDWKDKQMDKGP